MSKIKNEINGIKIQINNIFRSKDIMDIIAFAIVIICFVLTLIGVFSSSSIGPRITMFISIISTTIAFASGMVNTEARESLINKIAFFIYFVAITLIVIFSDLFRALPDQDLYSISSKLSLVGFFFTILFIFYNRLNDLMHNE